MKKALLILSLLTATAFAIEPPKAPAKVAPSQAKVEDAKPAPIDEHAVRVLAETRVKELETKVAELEAKLGQATAVCRVLEEQRNNIAVSLMDAQARIRIAVPQN